MRFSNLLFLFICLVTIAVSGCSSGGKSPLEPTDLAISEMPDLSPIYVSDRDADNNPTGGMGTLGYYTLALDPEKESAELTPLRTGALTDVLEIIDITNFMQIFPCTDCAKINSVGINADNNLVINLGIKHPFEEGNPAEIITGKNRADLHVFNVEGIVVSNLTGDAFGGLLELTPGFNLVNAHGYTDYLDAALDNIFLTFATIHPYITHFTAYNQGNFDASNPMGFATVYDPPPSGFCVMPMGSDYNNRDYIFEITGPMNFIFAIGCTYAVTTDTFAQRFSPEYRCPQHNKKAASKVTATITNNGLEAGNTISTAQLNIDVVDINHGVAVGTALDQMLADSSVDEIIVDIPGVMTNMLTVAGTSSISGSGHSPSDPLVYQVTITNTAGAVEGAYPGLLKVIDSYSPGQNTHPFVGVNDGGARVPPGTGPLEGLFEIDEFATYQSFTVDVGQSMLPPVGRIVSDPDPALINRYQTLDLDATSSNDPDGTITQYEFDFDWDNLPANFTADETNTTGLATTTTYPTAGDYSIGLRVTDNDTLIDYASLILHVNFRPIADLIKVPDVATIGQFEILTLDATGSYDPDGTIVLYEYDYDFDGDPATFVADESNTSGFVDHRFLDAGTFIAGVKAIDNNGSEGFANVNIEVTPAGNVLFVDDDNTDGPWDGTFNQPFQYIQDGVDAVPANNYTVWIMPGIYNEDPGGDSSSPDATITLPGTYDYITLYGEGNPVVALHEYDGGGDISGLYNGSSGSDYLTIDGLTFMPSSSYEYAIFVENTTGITIRNCSIVPIATGFEGFIKVVNGYEMLIEKNSLNDVVFDFTGWSDIIHINECDVDAIVTENTILGITFNVPSPVGGQTRIIGVVDSDHLTISKNIIGNCIIEANTGESQFFAIGLTSGSRDSIIRNNLIYNITFDSTLGVDSDYVYAIGNYWNENCEIYNNTIDSFGNPEVETLTHAIFLYGVDVVDIYNNIVTNAVSDSYCYGIGKYQAANPPDVDYCNVWNLTGTTVERYHNATEGPNGLEADPMFLALGLDYHLQPDSPCEGTGRNGDDMGCYGGVDPLP